MSDEFDDRRVGGTEAVEAPPDQQLEPDEAASESVLPPAETFEAEPAGKSEPEQPAATVESQPAAAVEAPPSTEHAYGELDIPGGFGVIEGSPDGAARRSVGIVVSRFNGEITQRLLDHAISALEELGVNRPNVTVMPVPGAFELPLAAMALAKTRRYACIVALGCIIRGETPHFDFVASEAASGLQLAALETGVPVGFGVLTVETREQAETRVAKGAEAVRTALEMAHVFSQLRTAGARS
jgi:6,7-dimethyl-8-ribityllumazine synthase